MSKQKKTLVILSKSFGTNFSGGTSATHFIFLPLEERFQRVIFVGKQLGEHQFKDLVFIKYTSVLHAVQVLNQLKREGPLIGYGDFYMTCFFILARVPYFFTYHDNWPELKNFGWENRLKAFFFIPLYKAIIRNALRTFSVSRYKQKFIRNHTERCSVVRNGIVVCSPNERRLREKKSGSLKVLMVGNIDRRKYGWAVGLFDLIKAQSNNKALQFDIYGHIMNRQTGRRLRRFEFVKLRGFSQRIYLSEYDILLSTSCVENLAITVVEALKSHLPVIAFDVGGLGEVIENSKNGILVPPGDLKEMQRLLFELADEMIDFSFNDGRLLEYDWQIASGKYADVIFGLNE